jgi:hypothetical protein
MRAVALFRATLDLLTRRTPSTGEHDGSELPARIDSASSHMARRSQQRDACMRLDLAIGARLTSRTNIPRSSPEATIIQIDVDPASISRSCGHSDRRPVDGSRDALSTQEKQHLPDAPRAAGGTSKLGGHG